MADDLKIDDYMADLRLNLNRLEGIVTEADQHISNRKLDSAALVLGSQTGKVERFTDSYGALQSKLREEGADPDRALRS